ncbi:MAG TPA: trypsin-like peptidase domain-containing protein [Anaerolineaceae bacterium]|nr:trypsin-like peptidase domain-containing protein [Anaerolineaceae bacterium]
MNEPEITRAELWRGRLHSVGSALRRSIPFFGGILAALVALLIYNYAFPHPHQITAQEVSQTVASAMASATPPPSFSSQVYQIIQPSLVLIQTRGKDKDGKEEDALGTGVVITDRGDILTSLHVVSGATEIDLTFADGTKATAEITNKQPENDIAVLHSNKLPGVLVPAVLGNPRSMQIGDEAYVVGNPFGLYNSMSAGIISGFDRSFRPPNSDQRLKGLIQIDTAVNPGNSGGPLLNRYGQVIGIVEGIVNPTGQDVFIGIGFAVPIDIAGGAIGSPPD